MVAEVVAKRLGLHLMVIYQSGGTKPYVAVDEVACPITSGSACTPGRSGRQASARRWWQYTVPLQRPAPCPE
jgi:hypothetical protein